MNSIVYSLQDIDTVVELLHKKMSYFKIFTFTGDLGAGKTTLVRALLRRCGIHGVIMSPTFTYLNVYENDLGQTFYHFDVYRIKNVQDFKAAGFDEYLYQPNSWVFIEWPEVVKPLLDHAVLNITLDHDNDKRVMHLEEIK